MHNYQFGPGAFTPHPGGEGESRHSFFSLVLLIVAIVVAAAVFLGLVFWTLGLVFSVVGLLIRVALVAAVAALVWRRVTRGRSRKYDY
jgi:hypothetical protein